MTPPLRLEERGAVDHERARTLASERLHASLPPHDARWLDDHLAGCTACRAVAEGYASDRLELEALRRQPIEPPRDLWARTSAAVEREAARSRGPRRAPFLRRHRPSPVPLGAASGLLVVAVVIGASLLSGQPGPSLSPRATAPSVAMSFGPSGEAGPVDPTPLAVAADVAWVSYGANGKLELNQARVSEVCTEGSAECAPIEAPSPGAIELPEPPRTVVRSPDDESLVLVEGDTDGTGGALTVVPGPTAA